MSTIPGITNSVSADVQSRSAAKSNANTDSAKPITVAPAAVDDKSSDDSVQLSEASQLASEIKREIASYPTVDESKVQELKAKIASGDYYPVGASIAGKMMALEGLMQDK